MNNLPLNVCLTFHCLYNKGLENPLVNQELFISSEDIKKLCINLKSKGYNFCLPETTIKNQRNCIITFDDGYYNNFYFLEIAEELKIPFIIFLSGYNIETNSPFLWDTIPYSNINLKYWNTDYSVSYNKVKESQLKLIDSIHRPFSIQELNSIGQSDYLNFGYHGYYHQPFTYFGENFIIRELNESDKFMNKIMHNKINHFAFPNGLYSIYSKWIIKSKYDYIYTIQSGEFSINSKFINRFSLLNPDIYGSLEGQILKANRFSRRIIRKIHTLKASYL
jgi:peptidoglycan/xylan/chitin deacetylase (PgdA/CDA1 family)